MGWRDLYLQASFRGVPFFVSRASTEVGRRTQLHVFPKRDTPFSEDLGRKPRIYSIDAYLVGDDFYDQKANLKDAVEAHGVGRLVHPYYGVLFVACRRCRFTDTNRELRMVRMSLEFEESGIAEEPDIQINTKAFANTTKVNGMATATNAFLATYTLVKQPFSEVRKLLAAVDQAIALVDTARRSVADIASFQRQIENLPNQVSSLINNAADLAVDIISIMTFGSYPFAGEVRVDSSNAKDQFDEMVTLFPGTDGVPRDSSSPVQSFNDFFQNVAVITAGGYIPEVDFDTIDELKVAADIVFAQVDTLEEAGMDDSDVLATFRSTRASIREDIEQREDRLPQLSTITLPDTIPALVLSNSLYGDLSKEDDILRRNGLDHPGFVPGVAEIQVLTNV